MTARAIRTILVVEDNLGDLRLLREMLTDSASRQNHATYVSSISDAEDYLSHHPIDVILLDLGLPDVQGLDAVRRARAAAPHIPLVVLTGLDDQLLALQALQAGAQDYLVKGEIETRGLLRALQYAIERKIMEEVLFLEKERAQVTLDSIGEGVACTDTDGRITFLNVVAEKLTGWSSAAAAGRPTGEVVRVLSSVSREVVADPTLMFSAQPIGADSSDRLLARKDGSELPIEGFAAQMHGREGRSIGAVIVFRDVSAARAMVQQMVHSAHHDFLTGLPNRMLFSDRLTQAIGRARRQKSRVAVLFLDLDGFKHINDSLGHPIGDRLLQSVAERLVACVRTADTVSRQGGDEFVVLLSEVARDEDAAAMSRRLLEGVAAVHALDHRDLHVTASIGVSVYPDDGVDAPTLIKNADTAMYQAKENGQGTYQFFKPSMNVKAVERHFIDDALRTALERCEFALHYQPIVNLQSGLITGVEALIRWTHPVRGSIPPAEFIPVAEDCRLILPIGRWVLREACTQAKAWVDAGLPPVTMAVNISAREFWHRDFLESVCATIDDTGVDPSSLELELTETILMRHGEATQSVLKTLRAKGVRLAIDDFGTGYSSLSYLNSFPVDALKIDQSFVRQIATAPDQPIVRAVISLGKSLKLRVTAEGVETPEELAFLQDLNCDEGQGYHFSRPVLPAQLAELLQSGLPALSTA
jgi:diguanylate cyclase (GGDEF)-like protein/PAS domain S-box-containing protein